MKNNLRYNLLNELANEQPYIDFLNAHKDYVPNSLIEAMEQLINESDYDERIKKWEEIWSNQMHKENIIKLSNPFYIGYGNPESDILILGQEKAFDPNKNYNLLFHESISNNFQWKWIIKQNLKIGEESNLIFDPRFPKAYFKNEFKKSHTWYKYSLLVAEIIGEVNYQRLIDTESSLQNSLFKHCFISEINFIPSKSNKRVKLANSRQEFLTHDFFKKFKYVIVAAGNLLKTKEEETMKTIFGADKVTDGQLLGNYGNGKKRLINIYKSANQTIFTCNQLSGSAGWKNEHIKAMGSIIKNV